MLTDQHRTQYSGLAGGFLRAIVAYKVVVVGGISDEEAASSSNGLDGHAHGCWIGFGADIGGHDHFPPAFAAISLQVFYRAVNFGPHASSDQAKVLDASLSQTRRKIRFEEHTLQVNQPWLIWQIARLMPEALLHLCRAPIVFVVEIADKSVIEACACWQHCINPLATAVSLQIGDS